MPEVYRCPLCPRSFESSNALFQHGQYMKTGHYLCHINRCGFGTNDWEAWMNHGRTTGHVHVCQACNDGDGSTFELDSEDWRRHLKDCHACRLCELHFDDDWFLGTHDDLHHRQRPDPLQNDPYKCISCTKLFAAVSSMVKHLESGSCRISHNFHSVIRDAACCAASTEYMDPQDRLDILNSTSIQGRRVLFCPRCNSRFARVSSLLRHAEGRSCSVRADIDALGDLVRTIGTRQIPKIRAEDDQSESFLKQINFEIDETVMEWLAEKFARLSLRYPP